ncbi:hypothetical protein K474DRAFT_1666666 [Panus rudis PR-1116 ss-1]|nr:hypothetical protein K474DRAFT_1666666 [Panus rudis PR-1116 ss-1]
MAGSESSLTSAYYSEPGSVQGGDLKLDGQGQTQTQQQQDPSAGFNPALRRGSCASVFERFEDLDVNGGGGGVDTPQPQQTHLLVEGGEPASTAGEEAQNEYCPPSGETTSARGSNHSSSSELSYALGQNVHSQNVQNGSRESLPRLMYPTEYPESTAQNEISKGPQDYSSYQVDNGDNPYQGNYAETGEEQGEVYHYSFTGMMASGGGEPTMYDTGAIELSNMCVPSPLALEGFNMVSYPPYT